MTSIVSVTACVADDKQLNVIVLDNGNVVQNNIVDNGDTRSVFLETGNVIQVKEVYKNAEKQKDTENIDVLLNEMGKNIEKYFSGDGSTHKNVLISDLEKIKTAFDDYFLKYDI